MSKITEKPRGGCALSGITSVLSAMERVCPVFHAGPGCAFQSGAAEEGHGGGVHFFGNGRNGAYLYETRRYA